MDITATVRNTANSLWEDGTFDGHSLSRMGTYRVQVGDALFVDWGVEVLPATLVFRVTGAQAFLPHHGLLRRLLAVPGKELFHLENNDELCYTVDFTCTPTLSTN